MGTNSTVNWDRRLAGEEVPILSTMEPDWGYYRVPTMDRTSWRPIFFGYSADGNLRCRIGTKENHRYLDPADAMLIWPTASQYAITEELYLAVFEGADWPDIGAELQRLSNSPPADESIESIREVIDNLVRLADRLIKKGAAKSQAESDEAANVATRLSEFWSKADRARDAEKRPYLDKCNEIQATWRPLLEAAAIHKTLKQIVCAPWLAAQKRAKERAEEAARAAAAEAQRRARDETAEAERRADDAVQTGNTNALAEATAAATRAETAQQQAVDATRKAHTIATTRVTAGTVGRRSIGLRKETVYSIENRDALFAFLSGNTKAAAEIDEIMLKHGRAIAKTGVAVPGLKSDVEEVAA